MIALLLFYEGSEGVRIIGGFSDAEEAMTFAVKTFDVIPYRTKRGKVPLGRKLALEFSPKNSGIEHYSHGEDAWMIDYAVISNIETVELWERV